MENADALPSPYLEGTFEPLIAEYPGSKWRATLETSRGCPFRCIFCEWGAGIHKRMQKFSLQRVFREIDWLAAHEIEWVYFADTNFGMYRQRDSAIVDYLIEIQQRTGFPKTVSMQWAKNSSRDVVELAGRLNTGLSRGLTLSVQSMSPKTLKAVRRDNLPLNDMKEMLDLCRRKNIRPYTELILGLPQESWASWRSGLYKLLRLGQHTAVEVWLLQVLSGAELNQPALKSLYGLETRRAADFFRCEPWKDDAGIFEEADVVFQTATLPHADLVKSYLFAWTLVNFHYYGWLQVVSRVLHGAFGIDYAEFYDAFWRYLQQGGTILHQEFREAERAFDSIYDSAPPNPRARSGLWISPYLLMFKAQLRFHLNQAEVWEAIGPFMRSWRQDARLAGRPLDDLLDFQRHFVWSPYRPGPYRRRFEADYLAFLQSGKPRLELKPVVYLFNSPFAFRGADDYLKQLIERRRQGFGMSLISRVDQEVCSPFPAGQRGAGATVGELNFGG